MTELRSEIARYFPYAEVRPYQDDFMETVCEAVEEGRSVLIEGSNGLGKTVAALSACLPKAIDRKLKVLYVARTHRQHDRVIEELKAISKESRVAGISIRARHEMCLNNLITRHPLDTRAAMEICELLKAQHRCPYYESIEDKEDERFEIQQQMALSPCTASEVLRICRRRGFCPYELVKASITDMDVIVMSYLYVFDPAIRNVFLRNLGAPLTKTILIVDEAHNLPETAVDIASSSLSIFTLKQAEAEAKRLDHEDIARFAKTVKSEIEEMTEKIGKQTVVPPEFLTELVQEKAGIDEPKKFFEHLHDTGVSIKRNLLIEGKYPRSFIHGTGYFMLRWLETAEDQSFINTISRYNSKQGLPTAKLEIVALDPSKITMPVFSQVRSTIAMSGTLQPLEAYIRITKLPENTVQKVVPSPFPKEHVLALISSGVTTAMEKRTPEMYRKIIKRVSEIVRNTPANTGIFVPSFEVLGALLVEGLKKALDKPLFCEHRSMDSRENEKMIVEFKTCSKNGGAVLLGVQGGRSSEGVDFPGDEMNSVAIVGLPYAEPTPKVRAQINYFERLFPGFGREYGYVLPAMKKACQAAGRPIRTLEDKGAIVFLDYRFASGYCQGFIPSWIRDNLAVLPDEDCALTRELRVFFKKAC
jgi:DNA excision repair protein ERCC-2